jgi:hypothetical protein
MSQEAPVVAAVSVKDHVRRLLETLPDNCTIEDVQYHLYVIEKVQRGLDEIDAGRGIPHEEIRREFCK